MNQWNQVEDGFSRVGEEWLNFFVSGRVRFMYDLIAPYYDLTHAQLTDDVGFLLWLARQGGGKVLELGCGTGRLLLPLARAGFVITGVDNSEAMLALAHQKLAQEDELVRGRITVLAADMLNLSGCGRDFTLVIIPYNTFMHFPPPQAEMLLRQIKQCLAPGGQLFIDLINPYIVAQTPNDHLLTLEQTVTDPRNGHTVLQFSRHHLETVNQVLHITWIYDATPPRGGPIHRTVVPVTYHYYYPHQLELLLDAASLSVTAWYGHYKQTPFAEDTPRLLLLAS